MRGRGEAPGGMLDMDLSRGSDSRPLREMRTRVMEHEDFLKKRVSGGSCHFFFFSPSILDVNEELRNRAVSSRSSLPSPAVADASPGARG